jgi:hypothetical protein
MVQVPSKKMLLTQCLLIKKESNFNDFLLNIKIITANVKKKIVKNFIEISIEWDFTSVTLHQWK